VRHIHSYEKNPETIRGIYTLITEDSDITPGMLSMTEDPEILPGVMYNLMAEDYKIRPGIYYYYCEGRR